MRKKTKKKLVTYGLFAAYLALMLWLLFFQRSGWDSGYTYLEHFRYQTNLIPFRTINEFIGHIRSGTEYAALSARNLAGNVVMFVPLGVFMPMIWKKLRRLRNFLAAVVLAVVCVEVLQLVTMLGSCDIDDLISNVLGAAAGWQLYKTLKKKKFKGNIYA